MERTLALLKPDAVQRGLVGRILSRFEDKGLKLIGMKMLRVSRPQARKMYQALRDKPYFGGLIGFTISGPVLAVVLEGDDAVAVVRRLMGPTNAPEAPAGTIRGDFGMCARSNLVHGSDSVKSARREIPLFFAARELCKYNLANARWVYTM